MSQVIVRDVRPRVSRTMFQLNFKAAAQLLEIDLVPV